MAKKTAKQTVAEIKAKVDEELQNPTVEHYFRCMTIVAPGSKCNCYAKQ